MAAYTCAERGEIFQKIFPVGQRLAGLSLLPGVDGRRQRLHRVQNRAPKLDPKSYKHFVPSIDFDFGIALVDLFRMAIVEVKDIPMWLREGLDEEAAEGVLNKRSEPRHGWMILTRARLLSSPDTKLTSVKTFNVSCGGLGLITRQELDQGDVLELSPMVDTGEPVHVRVVYCKQTIQGYKVGCEFVTD